MRAADLLRDAGRGLLDLVFAPMCLGCGSPITPAAPERSVCSVCWSRLRPLPHPRCLRCGSPEPAGIALQPGPRCSLCATLPPSLRAVRSAFVHQDPARELVHALKFGGWHGLAAPMGERMAMVEFPLEVEEEVRYLLPVPLSRVRMRERGYNQAALLGRAVAAARGWNCLDGALERVRATERQATLHPSERRANVAGAFRLAGGVARTVQGEHVLLVDDVWTTGATALACGDALLEAGARCFSVLTFARALPELDRGVAASSGSPAARNP